VTSVRRLFLVTPQGHIRNVDLTDTPVTLGRAVDNTLAFPEDDGLSRHHLAFEERDDVWVVRDLGSKNGTFVNGAPISGDHELQPGERVAASHVVMTYQEPSEGGGRISFEDSAPAKTELTYLGELLSAEGLTRERLAGAGGGLNWVFVRAGRELAEHRPLPELFSIILDLSLEAVAAERGVLFTVDEGGVLSMQASRGGDICISTTVRNNVLSNRASVLVRDVCQDEALEKSGATREQGICSLVAAPLQSDERVIGMVYLDSCDSRKRFNRDDMNVLTALANISGIRIELEQWELRKRQLIADNVENLGRLTAALSHELSNPLGALKSSLDTLWRTTQRGGALDDAEREKLDAVQSELRRTLDASLDRMQQVIARIQRFANLDRAETRSVDLPELLEDVVALARTSRGAVEITLTCDALPRVTCHPQPLSSALASVLAYVLEVCEAGGVGSVDVSASKRATSIEVQIRYRPIAGDASLSPDELERLFHPSFEVAKKRVEARNWSLFSARQVLRDQGGDVSAFSDSGEGNGFVVTLPLVTAED
jgi:signal transduction histidine kinase/pSer/pThr/pTyr-binding forkhead associated (FHA) protein